jgi:bacillithiol system protein YtxJ
VVKELLSGDNIMNWIPLTSEEDLETIKNSSGFSVIFKHSTRCGVSSVAKRYFEKDWSRPEIPVYYLDIISYRSISNKIAQDFEIPHESPQVLLIRNGGCIYNESHSSIEAKDVMTLIAS